MCLRLKRNLNGNLTLEKSRIVNKGESRVRKLSLRIVSISSKKTFQIIYKLFSLFSQQFLKNGLLLQVLDNLCTHIKERVFMFVSERERERERERVRERER